MNLRRSTRQRNKADMSVDLDASFQIPFTVNATANNLLLDDDDDDALQREFFGEADWTINTSIAPRKTPGTAKKRKVAESSRGRRVSQQQKSEQQPGPSNSTSWQDDDYRHENTRHQDEEMSDHEATPTPMPARSKAKAKTKATSRGSNVVTDSRIPAPFQFNSLSPSHSRSPTPTATRELNSVLSNADAVARDNSLAGTEPSLSSHRSTRPPTSKSRVSVSSVSSSSTRALPSTRTNSNDIRADKVIREFPTDNNNLPHKHAADCNAPQETTRYGTESNVVAIDTGADAEMTPLAPNVEVVRDPHSPERTPRARPKSTSRKSKTVSLRTAGTRTRKSIRSPSPLIQAARGEIDRDIVELMPLALEDGARDLQDRGESTSIQKHVSRNEEQEQSGSGSAVQGKKTMGMTKGGASYGSGQEDRKGKGREKEITVMEKTNIADATSKLKEHASKVRETRNGDNLGVVQPAEKITDVGAHPGSKPSSSENSRKSVVRAKFTVPGPSSFASKILPQVPEEDEYIDLEHSNIELEEGKFNSKLGEAELGRVLEPTLTPANPQVETSFTQYNSQLNSEPGQFGVDEEPDEVQNFLSQYAKKYGSNINEASVPPIIPKALAFNAAKAQSKPSSAASAPPVLPILTAPTRRETSSETSIPEGKRIRVTRTKQSTLKLDRKTKSNVGERETRYEVPDKDKRSNTHSKPLSLGSVDGGVPAKKGSQTGDKMSSKSSSVLPELIHVDAPRPSSPSRLILSGSQDQESVPGTYQVIGDVEIGQSFDAGNPGLAGMDGENEARQRQESESRVLRDNGTISKVVRSSAVPDPSAEVPETTSTTGKTYSLSSSTKRKERGEGDTRGGRSETYEGAPPLKKKKPVSSAPQAPVRVGRTESRPDDMFARKKRDNYLQKGLDLTAHSSRRHAQKAEDEVNPISNAVVAQPHQIAGQGKPKLTVVEHQEKKKSGTTSSVAGAATVVPGPSQIKQLDQATEKRVHQAGASPPRDLECSDRAKDKPRTSRKDDSSKNSNGPAEKPRLQTHEEKGHKTRDASITPERRIEKKNEKRQSDVGLDDAANVSTGSIGSAIAERLVSFSQKIMGTIGFLNSLSQIEPTESSEEAIDSDAKDSHLTNTKRGHRISKESRGHGSQGRISPVQNLEAPPRRTRRGSETVNSESQHDNRKDGDRIDLARRPRIAESDKNEIKKNKRRLHGGQLPSTRATDVRRLPPDIRPSPKPRKRPAGDTIDEATDKQMNAGEEIDFAASERKSKKAKFSCDETIDAGGPTGTSDKPRGITSSVRRRATGPKNSPRGLLARSKVKTKTSATSRSVASRNAEARSSHQTTGRTRGAESIESGKRSRGLTVPIAPVFVGDMLRQQRVLARSEREHERQEKGEEVEGRHFKSDATVADKRAPLSNKQKPLDVPPPKPTVPHAFQFKTDIRVAKRSTEFEEKLRTWERISTSGSSSNNYPTSRKPLPDFRSIHAAQESELANMAARRQKFIAPTRPISPHFAVDARLEERGKFEEGRRAREMEAERLKEEEQRETEEEEERERREARRRAVPRAHVVPEWYAEAPKKSVRSRQ